MGMGVEGKRGVKLTPSRLGFSIWVGVATIYQSEVNRWRNGVGCGENPELHFHQVSFVMPFEQPGGDIKQGISNTNLQSREKSTQANTFGYHQHRDIFYGSTVD